MQGAEWTLCQEIVKITKRWPATIDLIAISLPYRLSVYFAHLQDLMSREIPCSRIGRICRVMPSLTFHSSVRQTRGCQLILIASQKEWFPDMLELLVEPSLQLLMQRDLLRKPHFSQNTYEPLRATASCVATLQRFTKYEGFSSRVAKQLTLTSRKSTNLINQQNGQVFRKWCKGRGVSVFRLTAKNGWLLLYVRNEKKLTASSIKGRRSMLAFMFQTKFKKGNWLDSFEDALMSPSFWTT